MAKTPYEIIAYEQRCENIIKMIGMDPDYYGDLFVGKSAANSKMAVIRVNASKQSYVVETNRMLGLILLCLIPSTHLLPCFYWFGNNYKLKGLLLDSVAKKAIFVE
jgi:hypothetical protein